LLDHQNNYVKRLSVDNNVAKSFNILTIESVLHNYFDSLNKIIFRSISIFLDTLDTSQTIFFM